MPQVSKVYPPRRTPQDPGPDLCAEVLKVGCKALLKPQLSPVPEGGSSSSSSSSKVRGQHQCSAGGSRSIKGQREQRAGITVPPARSLCAQFQWRRSSESSTGCRPAPLFPPPPPRPPPTHLGVTRLPNHWCTISWHTVVATRNCCDRSSWPGCISRADSLQPGGGERGRGRGATVVQARVQQQIGFPAARPPWREGGRERGGRVLQGCPRCLSSSPLLYPPLSKGRSSRAFGQQRLPSPPSLPPHTSRQAPPPLYRQIQHPRPLPTLNVTPTFLLPPPPQPERDEPPVLHGPGTEAG